MTGGLPVPQSACAPSRRAGPSGAWGNEHVRAGLSLGLVALLAAALVPGCLGEPIPITSARPARKGPELVPAGGRVTVDGKPLAGAVLTFLPVFSDEGTYSVGETGPDGRYALSTMLVPGAGPGEYRVAVSYQVGANGKVVSLSARSAVVLPEEFNTARELVPPRYSDLSKTELRATIERGGAPLDFALEGPLREPPGASQ